MEQYIIENARRKLEAAEVFLYNSKEERDEIPEREKKFRLEQALNLNDSYAWAMSDMERVEDEELPRLADLYSLYGWNGILYWVLEEKRKGEDHVEFESVKRALQFIRAEEENLAAAKKENPESFSHLLYRKCSYKIGEGDWNSPVAYIP